MMLARSVLQRGGNVLPALAATRGFADQSTTDKMRDAAGKVTEKVSDAAKGAKEFVKETTDRVKYDQESLEDKFNDKASRVADGATRLTDRMSGVGNAAATSAAEGNTAATDAATQGTHEARNPLTGERGPSSMNVHGGIDTLAGSVGDKIPVEQAAGKTDREPLGAVPSGTAPLNEKQKEGEEYMRMGRGTSGPANTDNTSRV